LDLLEIIFKCQGEGKCDKIRILPEAETSLTSSFNKLGFSETSLFSSALESVGKLMAAAFFQ